MLHNATRLILAITVIGWSQIASGQTAAAISGSGFTAPVPIFIAPGGLTTIFVHGIGTRISEPVMASSVPLPTTLAGISVFLRQTESPQGPIPVPLLAVFPVKSCRTPVFEPCGGLTGINLQIPFELAAGLPPRGANFAQLVISEEGGGRATVEAVPLSDRIHILRVGDILTNPAAGNIDRPRSALNPVVTHADGKPLSGAAQPGETLVLYAVGLGPVTPSVRSGERTPAPSPEAVVRIAFDFNFRGEVSPHYPTSGARPAFAGLTPGFVGLYQVNFVVPELPPDYRIVCGTELGRTNLTVSIGVVTSFDGAGICVQVGGR